MRSFPSLDQDGNIIANKRIETDDEGVDKDPMRVLSWEQMSELQDYGFSAIDQPETLGATIAEKAEADVQKWRSKYVAKRDEAALLRKAVEPILRKLIETSDKDYVYWPDRKDKLETLIKQLGWDKIDR